MKKKNILKANSDLIKKAGNLQEIKLNVCFRKIQSEALAKNDRDTNDILDLLKMQKDHPEYIKYFVSF